MKDRIKKIMDNENLTPAKFADKLQINRAVVSHILTGRNNPSLDVVTKILSEMNYLNSDWLLNGDLVFWHEPLDMAMELSSMGIRVDAEKLYEQLEKADALNRLQYEFHQKVMDGTLPLTIGGGIGQSRMCMLLLQKAHIGEVQVSLWDDETIENCDKKIKLL